MLLTDIKNYGFKPAELMEGGIINATVGPNSLSNTIHPLFEFDHWDNTPYAVWQFLAPALRLASNSLTVPTAYKFWTTLLYGERNPNSHISVHNEKRLRKDVEVTVENYSKAYDYLYELGDQNNIIIDDSNSSDAQVLNCHGTTTFNYRMERATQKLTSVSNRYIEPLTHIPRTR